MVWSFLDGLIGREASRVPVSLCFQYARFCVVALEIERFAYLRGFSVLILGGLQDFPVCMCRHRVQGGFGEEVLV